MKINMEVAYDVFLWLPKNILKIQRQQKDINGFIKTPYLLKNLNACM